MNKFYITTPIYYVNDKPHIGHAYTTVAADILARWHKLQGKDVFFLTGTDEHGAKVAQAAEKAGQSPKEFCDNRTQDFQDAWKLFNIKYDKFIRTTDAAHEAAISRALQRMFERDFIYQGTYEGLYCVGCEQYKTSDDLIDGKCPEHLIEPQLMKEESYFFKLSFFGKELEEKILNDELAIEPKERKNEVLSFIRGGLKDISISRKNIKWGIPLPFDKEHTTYVWVDALLNYLTGIGWNGDNEKDLPWWPVDVQLMAKDIVRVHATIWPGLLMALNTEFNLPKKFFVHGFFTINGQKMSKSLGNVIWPEDMIAKFGADASRYLLMASTPFGQDGDISWEKMTAKYNADLANGLGNLVSRVFKLASDYSSTELRQQIEASGEVLDFARTINDSMEAMKLFETLQLIREKIVWANQRIDATKLWDLMKTNKDEAQKILTELLGVIVAIGEVLASFMPETSEKILTAAKAEKIEKGEGLFLRVKY